MLASHMDKVEQALLARSKIPGGAGHPSNIGTPRETFINEFLATHLAENVGVGSGEVIGADSKPGEKRNQIDVVIYRRDYPRLEFAEGVHAFLVESIVATIEVKSRLDQRAVRQASEAARSIKLLNQSLVRYRSFSAGYLPPAPLAFAVAYDGPANMQRVHSWVNAAAKDLGFEYPDMPPRGVDRQKVASAALDGVFLLGKGSIHFDNFPIGLLDDATRAEQPTPKWTIINSSTGNLLLLFLLLTTASSGVSGWRLNPLAYLKDFSVSDPVFEP